MKSMPAGRFKAQCLAVMDQVQATGESVLITKHGVPVAKLVAATTGTNILGSMANDFTIVGDVESPAVPAKTWTATRGGKR
jgi:prevent-host-death family protein